MTRLLQQYKTKIQPELKTELSIGNALAVPRIEKIVVNAGIGRVLQQNPKNLDKLVEAFRKITGQQPIQTRASKAIAGFKIRQGQIVGMTATLRGKRMYDFLDKFINVAMPRTRDFRGLSPKGFDGRGNYSAGLKEHIVFPEMSEADVEAVFGLQITIATTAGNDDAGYKLLKKFGFPFSAESGSASGGKVTRRRK